MYCCLLGSTQVVVLVLSIAGDQVPVMLFLEVAGRVKVPPSQIAAIASKVGRTLGLTVTVVVQVEVLPQASVTVHVYVTDTKHPVTTSGCTVPVAVNPVEQLSVTVAVPNAEVS